MRTRRYRAIVCCIPLFLVAYVVTVSMKPAVSNTRDAVFPIFSWALFATTPSWVTYTNVVVAHSVDGRTVRQYIIPGRSPADLKSLNHAVARCVTKPHCDEEVEALLYPIITRATGAKSVEFTVATESVDLRDVREGIHDIAKGTVSKTSYLTGYQTIGRWSTVHGRVSLVPPSLDATALVFEAHFDGYLGPCVVSGTCLTFEKRSCTDADLIAPFFINLYPRDVQDLPEAMQKRGFEAVRFEPAATFVDERCIITRPIPDYDIDWLETGQYRHGLARVWTERVDFPADNTAADR